MSQTKLKTLVQAVITLGSIASISGQNFGQFLGRPPFNILPYFPYPQNNNLFRPLPFPFQNSRPQPQGPPPPSSSSQIQPAGPSQPQSSQSNNQIPVLAQAQNPQSSPSGPGPSGPGFESSNGLVQFFQQLPNLGNQNGRVKVPAEPEQTANVRSISIDGSNKPVYTILPFNFTGTDFRPSVNQLALQEPQGDQSVSGIEANGNLNPMDQEKNDGKKSPKFFVPVLIVPTG